MNKKKRKTTSKNYKQKDFKKQLKSYREKTFSRMPKMYAKYEFKHEIPTYTYICYPLRNNAMEALMIDGKLIVGNHIVLNPSILKHFEVALKISEFDDIIFEGVITVNGETKNAILRNLTSSKPSENLYFICQDAVVCRRYDEPYYKRILNIPSALPNFLKENFVTIGPSNKNLIWVYEQELEKLSGEGVIDCTGFIFRPDNKPYFVKKYNRKKEVFFKSVFE